ncbi:RNA 2',3'-cyclic phosphodiesterase [Candidatus Bathyarchaeota archaeon]|nr:RNA 2',3'-cyclic phosphodiesterase [Candidatus Bathyarchaeota archaeon]MBS7618525.1 RNA 2',3'-cyclic phosphodiesterase [Candidatus Bathyarchaeota archaeon]
MSVDVEDSGILQIIQNLQKRIEETENIVKTVEVENLHLTLRFLGELPQPAVKRIMDGLKSLSFKPFKIEFKGLGVFPNLSYVRVVWVGVGEGVDKLENLHSQINGVLKRLGFGVEEFSPHLTLARVKAIRNRPGLAKLLDEYRDVSFGYMDVTSVRVKKSALTPKGPIYTTIMEVKAGP